MLPIDLDDKRMVERMRGGGALLLDQKDCSEKQSFKDNVLLASLNQVLLCSLVTVVIKK